MVHHGAPAPLVVHYYIGAPLSPVFGAPGPPRANTGPPRANRGPPAPHRHHGAPAPLVVHYYIGAPLSPAFGAPGPPRANTGPGGPQHHHNYCRRTWTNKREIKRRINRRIKRRINRRNRAHKSSPIYRCGNPSTIGSLTILRYRDHHGAPAPHLDQGCGAPRSPAIGAPRAHHHGAPARLSPGHGKQSPRSTCSATKLHHHGRTTEHHGA